MCSAEMAASDEEAWYFDGSGVPVGWNEGAVAFRVVPFVVAAARSSRGVAMGAMMRRSPMLEGGLEVFVGFFR